MKNAPKNNYRAISLLQLKGTSLQVTLQYINMVYAHRQNWFPSKYWEQVPCEREKKTIQGPQADTQNNITNPVKNIKLTIIAISWQ